MKTQSRVLIAIGASTCALVVVIAFQNCGQDLGAANSSANGYSTGIAFPFSAKTDLFGYMSCDRMVPTYNRSQYFTFRARASGGRSGLQPSNAFEQFITSSKFNAANQFATVKNSAYAGATLQMSLRSISAPNVYLQGIGTAADSAGEVSSWGSLTGSANLTTVLGNGTNGTRSMDGANMMLQVSGNGNNLGGHTDQYASSGLVQQIAQNQIELVLGYYSPTFNSGLTLLNPAGSISSGAYNVTAYGTMFSPTFSKPYSAVGAQTNLAGHGYNVLSALNESDLATQPATNIPGWTCQGFANQFIVLPYDSAAAARAGCLDPATAKTTTYSDPESIRKFNAANALLNDGIPNLYWVIDATHNCVFPSQGSSVACYNSSGNGTEDAAFVANPSETCGTGAAGIGLCPHYFSFCSATR